MTSLLLASWLLTQQWSWDKVQPTPEASVQGYRIYWSTQPTTWCITGRIEVPTSQCDATSCWGDTPEVPGDIVFFILTAYNDAGEGPTEHGEVTTCP